jgi:hypothetical protein
VLDELTQALFLFENLDKIVSEPDAEDKYLGKWSTRWTAIEGLTDFFNKITEELVDPGALITCGVSSPVKSYPGKVSQSRAAPVDISRWSVLSLAEE